VTSVDEKLAMHERAALDDVLAWAGSQSTLASLVGVTQQAVQSWVDRGRISATAAVKVEQLSQGRFLAKDLRPNVAEWWHEQIGKGTGPEGDHA
jgi:DNA-binding transcriptional regulator YdaS (Cro superfamily)